MSEFARCARTLPLPGALPADPLPAARPLPESLLAALQGGSAAARAQLAAGSARLVVTGQQPCFPLPLGLSLQKAATAIALAAQLRAAGEGPVYACFWSAADDSDFAEARGQLLARAGRPPLAVGLPSAQERPGGFVGDLEIAGPFAELAGLSGLAGRFAPFAPREGEDLGAHAARLLSELFAPWGLFVLDSRAEALRKAAAPLYERYAGRRAAFAAALDAAGEALGAAGGERPLREGIGERALFFLRSRRRLLPPLKDYGAVLARRLAKAPAELSPNAALRPLVQDAVLPVAARVLGPAEWEYHRQIQAGFGVLDLPFAPALPRLRLRSGRDLAAGLDGEGRGSSPLGWPGHPLADPTELLRLAERHLAAWAAGQHIEWTLEPLSEGV